MTDLLIFIGLPLCVFAAAAAVAALQTRRERREARGAVYRPLHSLCGPWGRS